MYHLQTLKLSKIRNPVLLSRVRFQVSLPSREPLPEVGGDGESSSAREQTLAAAPSCAQLRAAEVRTRRLCVELDDPALRGLLQ